MNGPASATRMPRPPMRIYAAAMGAVRRHRALFRMLFGFRPPAAIEGPLWDWTTLELRRAMAERVPRGASLLDMGTGPVAVLAIWANRNRGCEVTAVDHVPDVVERARAAVWACGASATVAQSSLFQAVEGCFDAIVFNAPYIDESSGARLGLLNTDAARRRWGGGEDGLATVGRFLAGAHGHLADGGEVLLGVNLFYVTDSGVRGLAEAHGWRVARVRGNRLTRAAVYSFVRPPAAGYTPGS